MNILLYIILAALLGGGALPGAERGLEARLRDSVNEAKKVRVDVHRGHRSPFSKTVEKITIELEGFQLAHRPAATEEIVYNPGRDTLTGRVNNIEIIARDFTVQGLPVKEMRVSFRRLRYNLKKALFKKRLEVVDLEACTAQIILEEKALNSYLAPRVTTMENFSLDLLRGRVEISGKVKTPLRLAVPITLDASLRPEIGRVHLSEPKLKLTSVPIPSRITEQVLKQVNPVIDLNADPDLFCIVNLNKISARPATVEASADIIFRPTRHSKKEAPAPTPAPAPPKVAPPQVAPPAPDYTEIRK